MATQSMERAQGAGAVSRGETSGNGGMFGGIFSRATPEQVAYGLGWFSMALGFGELLAPGAISGVVGARGRHGALMRFLGIREIAAGALILSGAKAAGCWSRVAGDLMDLALLGGDLSTPGTDKARAIGSTAAVVGVTVLDALTAWELSQSQAGAYDVFVERAVTINQSPEECYRYWRDFENLPRFLSHLKSVRTIGENRTHWIARVGGKEFAWDAEVTADEPGRCISWRSLESAEVDHAGSVRFDEAPAGRGTIVRVQLHYSPPAGGAGAMVAKILGRYPEQEVYKSLRRLKQVMETGDVVTTEGQPAGRSSGATWLDAIAR